MAIEALIVKGIGRGAHRSLAIWIPKGMPLEDLLRDLRERLQNSRGFFAGTSVALRGRPLSEAEREMVAQLVAEFGMVLAEERVEGMKEPAPASRESEEANDPTPEENGENLGMRVPDGPPDHCTLLVRRTLRSGQRIFHDGHVVVLGDVNPGAVVTCTGDIVVFGRLRGVAHAGAGGNVGARVTAFRLEPTQLRIAHYISRAPDEGNTVPGVPEVALVKNGVIEIQAFNP